MDFKGQALAEKLFYYIIILFGVVGWVLGYVQNSFQVSFNVWLVGTGLSLLVVVPDWPVYNRNPIKWLEPPPKAPEDTDDSKAANDAAKKSKGWLW